MLLKYSKTISLGQAFEWSYKIWSRNLGRNWPGGSCLQALMWGQVGLQSSVGWTVQNVWMPPSHSCSDAGRSAHLRSFQTGSFCIAELCTAGFPQSEHLKRSMQKSHDLSWPCHESHSASLLYHSLSYKQITKGSPDARDRS